MGQVLPVIAFPSEILRFGAQQVPDHYVLQWFGPEQVRNHYVLKWIQHRIGNLQNLPSSPIGEL